MFVRHRRALQMYASRLVENPQELLHDCLVKVLTRKDFQLFSHNKGEFCSWFTRIIQNAARDQHRRQVVRERFEVLVPIGASDKPLGGEESNILEGLTVDPPSDLQVDVRAAIEGLPPLSRWAAERVFIEGMSYREAAVDIGLPEPVMREAGRVALKILRSRLHDYQGGVL